MKNRFTLDAIFTSNLVFQADEVIRLFGTCLKGIEITCEFLDQVYSIKTKSDTFLFELPALPKLRESFSLTLTSKRQVVLLENCVVGDVFLFAGGNNLLMTLDESFSVKPSTLKDIRYLEVTRSPYDGCKEEFSELVTISTGWRPFKNDDVLSMSAVAYFFAKRLHYELDYPIGIINAAYPNASLIAYTGMLEVCAIDDLAKCRSIYKEAELAVSHHYPAHFHKEALKQIKNQEFFRQLRQNGVPYDVAIEEANEAYPYHLPMGPKHFNRPSGLFEQLIKPIQQFPIKACVLAFGENEETCASDVKGLYQALFRSWRKAFSLPRLPFFIIQLPPFSKSSVPVDLFAIIRDGQIQAVKETDQCALIPTLDLGEEKTPFSRDKEEIGKRLAKVILERLYRLEKNQLAPCYFSHQFNQGNLSIYTEYNHLFLASKSQNQMGFWVSDDGQTFRPVRHVKLVTNQVQMVLSPNAKEVRYCYQNFPVCDIFTTNEIPLMPFRIVL